MDIIKIDRDVAYVVMAIYVCCKSLFQMFHMFFQTYVASMFIWLLHMFHTYVASVLSRCCICFAWAFQVFFASVLDVCFKCFICLQKYVVNVYLDISKVDRVLHMLQWRQWLAGSGLP
jgi:hypothetical protein